MEVLRSKGVNMVSFELNYTVDSVQEILDFTMDVDMLAHFDEWQRTGQDDFYEAEYQWPVELHRARVITVVDYIQVLCSFSFWWITSRFLLLFCRIYIYISLIYRFRHKELVGS